MNWFFKRKSQAPPAAKPQATANQINFMILGNHMMMGLPELENGSVDVPLLCARLADFQRDARIQPVEPVTVTTALENLDVDSRKKVSLLVRGLNDVPTRTVFLALNGSNAEKQLAFLCSCATDQKLLTIPILLESALRKEEFIRHFIHQLGATVAGETPSESQERLRRLDYGALLAEADQARASAADRVAYLKKLQEEQEQRLGRRGKM